MLDTLRLTRATCVHICLAFMESEPLKKKNKTKRKVKRRNGSGRYSACVANALSAMHGSARCYSIASSKLVSLFSCEGINAVLQACACALTAGPVALPVRRHGVRPLAAFAQAPPVPATAAAVLRCRHSHYKWSPTLRCGGARHRPTRGPRERGWPSFLFSHPILARAPSRVRRSIRHPGRGCLSRGEAAM